MRNFLPALNWFSGYGAGALRQDLVSGITVALVLIPQSMAYAQLAGLPPYYGLYASFLPPVVAALFGSSRQLSTGPVAVVAMMTSAALEPMAVAGSQGYIAYAVLLALLVGIIQFGLGVLRLGVVVNLLSHPVLLGFTNAAAIVIATSQLGKFLGVPVDKGHTHFETVWRIIQAALDYVYWPTIAFGTGALAGMLYLKWKYPKLPYVLIAVTIATVISWATDYGLDRKVSISQIECPDLPDLVSKFNQELMTIETFTATRSRLRPQVERISREHGKPCSRCHPARTIGTDVLETAPPGINKGKWNMKQYQEKILVLHLMAGVIDEFIADAKEKLVKFRACLKGYKFVAVKLPDGTTRYYQRYKVPYNARTDWRIWRIKAYNKPISRDALILAAGGGVVGDIPKGLPGFSMPCHDIDIARKLLLSAFVIALVGFMEAISIAKVMAAKSGQKLDANQELIGQGIANIAGSFFSSFPVSGSFSRSAVNFESGAQTGMSSIFTSMVVILVMLFLTPLLYHLPQSVLAAVIMVAVLGLINIKGLKHTFKVSMADGVISLITFVTTLAFAPHLDKGVLTGTLLSLVVFFYRMMRPSIAVLSLWKDGHYRDSKKYNLALCRYIAIIRFDGPFFFANIGYLDEEVLRIVNDRKELRAIILKCNGINVIDASGEEALALMVDRLRAAGYRVYFSGIKENVLEVIQNSSLYSRIGPENIFATLAIALSKIWDTYHYDSQEEECPLKKVIYKQATKT